MEILQDTVEEEGRVTSFSSEASSPQEEAGGCSNGISEASLKQEAASLGWPLRKTSVSDPVEKDEEEEAHKEYVPIQMKSNISEIEMMKERFAKLLLGEDMSGCGKGVCTALAISNAITNLSATVFGQLWRLEPIPTEKKTMWRREMEWLLSVSDRIIELIPSWQTFPDGSKLEVMTCRPRSDLYINLPALRKLDNMLLELLDGFSSPEFWYVDQGILSSDTLPLQEEKWWLPVPRVPPGGIPENARNELRHKRECANQILKAAIAINSNALAEMEIPDSYLSSLPKNGRASIGDVLYHYIASEQFSLARFLAFLDLSSEHQALEIVNRVEAAMYLWRLKVCSKDKPSWGKIKKMMVDIEKRELLADRAESILLCLKQRLPGLTQTALEMSRIQYNKDVGISILESYSRVLESLASNIVARINDLIYADDMAKYSDQFFSAPSVNIVAHKRVQDPSFSPASLVATTREGRPAFFNRKNVTWAMKPRQKITGTNLWCHDQS